MRSDDVFTVAKRVRAGEVSATEVVESCLELVSSPAQDEINAFVFVDDVGARGAAAEVDRARARGEELGPLAGVPFGVKELQHVKGWPATAGSEAFAHRTAQHTDTMVGRLQRAGAIAVGLTASPELGRSSYCSTPLHGTTRNPWDLSLTPGGSSSGSAAAVAAGVTPLCTGSDGAGSLRIPASFCGVVGFKPTTGIVPRGPEFPGTAANQAYGPITTTVRDAALVMDAIVGVDDGEFGSVAMPRGFVQALGQSAGGLRVGYSADLGYSPVDPVVRAATEAACGRLVEAIDGRPVDLQDRIRLPDGGEAFRTLSMLDVWAHVRGLTSEEMALLGPSVRQYSDYVEQRSFDDYIDAQQFRSDLTRTVAEIFEQVDLLVTPSTPVVAFGAEGPMPQEIDGRQVDHWGGLRLTYPFNLTGHPAVSLPVAGVPGPPVGMQIVTRRFADQLLMSVAAQYEAAAPWQRHAPGSLARDAEAAR